MNNIQVTENFNLLIKINSNGTLIPLAIIIKTKKWYINSYHYLGKCTINGYNGEHWTIWINNNKRILSYINNNYKFIIQKYNI